MKLKSYEYNAALAINGAVKGSSREKLYQELSLGTLLKRRWLRRFSLFYKIEKNKSPSCLFRLMPTSNRMHITRNINNLKGINVKHNFFKNSNFSSVISEWNKLDLKTLDSNTSESFKEQTLKFVVPR